MRYEDVVLADGPVGYWPLTELTGTTAKGYGSTAVDGSWNGSPVYGAIPFPAGGRLPYLGASGYVSIADNAAWSPHAGASGLFTMEAWFLASVVHANTAFILSKGAGVGSYEFQLDISSTGLVSGNMITTAGSGNGIQTTSAVALNRWYHIVCTYDKAGNYQALFLNGRLVGTSTISITTGDATSAMQMGRRADAGGVLFNGGIGHEALYNKILPANRIDAHFKAGIGFALKKRTIKHLF